jgi:DtxR family Mn-dependent transcriptional regulator
MDESIADEDACQIEHSLHPQTVERLKGFIEFVRTSPDDQCWVMRYRSFLETGDAGTSECPRR